MSNLSSPTALTPHHRARKRRAKRGIVANYIHEISPRHRASEPVTAAAPSTPILAAPAPAAATAEVVG